MVGAAEEDEIRDVIVQSCDLWYRKSNGKLVINDSNTEIYWKDWGQRKEDQWDRCHSSEKR